MLHGAAKHPETPLLWTLNYSIVIVLCKHVGSEYIEWSFENFHVKRNASFIIIIVKDGLGLWLEQRYQQRDTESISSTDIRIILNLTNCITKTLSKFPNKTFVICRLNSMFYVPLFFIFGFLREHPLVYWKYVCNCNIHTNHAAFTALEEKKIV